MPSSRPVSPARPDADWWRQAVVYQVYPRSFADASGDGIGDVRGITSRADYLASLGVDAVWVSPFYPSALADGGYDVDDYRDVDPVLGTLEDFDELVATLHARGVRVIVDIVPNHSSDRHAWFRQALAAGPGSPERERYVFRDGSGPDGAEPPSDWESVFGGPAWERVPDGQWYLHMFAPEQPDFNWDHPEVREDFLRTLRFWSDRGVDGFRVDVAHSLVKDLSEPLAPAAELPPIPPALGRHPLWDQDGVRGCTPVAARARRVRPSRTAVAEALVHRSRSRRTAADGLRRPSPSTWSTPRRTRRPSTRSSPTCSTATTSRRVLDVGAGQPSRRASRLASGSPGNRATISEAWLRADGPGPGARPRHRLRRARAPPSSCSRYRARPTSTGEELGSTSRRPADDALQTDVEAVRTRREGRDGCRSRSPGRRTGVVRLRGPRRTASAGLVAR